MWSPEKKYYFVHDRPASHRVSTETTIRYGISYCGCVASAENTDENLFLELQRNEKQKSHSKRCPCGHRLDLDLFFFIEITIKISFSFFNDMHASASHLNCIFHSLWR